MDSNYIYPEYVNIKVFLVLFTIREEQKELIESDITYVKHRVISDEEIVTPQG